MKGARPVPGGMTVGWYPYRDDVGEWPSQWEEPGRSPNLPNGLAITPPGKWVENAACNPASGDEFFPDEGSKSNYAKFVCNAVCPVRSECLDYALANNEQDGIWGGMTPSERKREKARRKAIQEGEAAA